VSARKALLLGFAALTLSACQPEDVTAWGTVIGVQQVEAATVENADDPVFGYDNLRIPEVGWRVDIQLDDGREVSLTAQRNHRYEPGERVRLLRDAEYGLFL
jgi:hypothetical protein